MISMHRVFGAVILSLLLAGVMSDRANLPRYRLHKKLFTGYNKNVRPSKEINDTVTDVLVTFNLQAVVNLDERQQTLTTSGVLYMEWVDEGLKWDPKEYGNTSTMIVNQEDMWVPDINVRNTIISTEQLGYERGPLLVEHNGSLTWQPHCVFETLCSIDITYFPFDLQNCSLILGSRQTVSTEVHINADPKAAVIFWGFSPNSQWQMVRVDFRTENAPKLLSIFQTDIILRRRPTKIICNIFIPVIFLSVAANLVFLLPIDGGERMSTVVTILLAYAVYLTIVADSLPMNARKISYLELYLLLLLGVATTIAVANIIVVRMERKKGELSVRMAKTMRNLRPFLCLHCCDPKQKAKCRDFDSTAHLNKGEAQNPMLVRAPKDASADTMSYSQGAQILDRLFLIVFSIATCVISIFFFCIIAAGPRAPENNVVTTDYPHAAQ